MAASYHHSGGSGAHRHKGQPWRMEPPPPQKRGRGMMVLLLLVGGAAVFLVSDHEWKWRESLQRLVQGQASPAFRANEWSDVRAVRETLSERLLTTDLTSSGLEHDTCRDLALYSLIMAAGEPVFSRNGAELCELMEELSLDTNWLEEIVHWCPMKHAENALPLLAHIYHKEKARMAGMPEHRRLAAAIAFEFARAGLGAEAAHAHYQYYASSGKKFQLNNRFARLAIWEMAALASRGTDAKWNSSRTLEWFQRNARMPAQGYVHAGQALGAHEECLFGVEVDTPAFMEIYRDAAADGTAKIYEASGCSTPLSRAAYAATAACANGVPAVTVSWGDGAACMVDVCGRWEASAPMPEDASCSWNFMEQAHPDFVRLAAALGGEKDKSLAAARLALMAQFLYDAGNRPLAQSLYRESVNVQPLNYAAWAGYHTAGASREEMQQAAAHFTEFPGVSAALHRLAGE